MRPRKTTLRTSRTQPRADFLEKCKNLQPAYEKAAGTLAGQAQVAAVNCDEEANKPFCGSMGVQGFPTLKIVKPAKKAGGRPVVEDYQGARTAKAIVEAVRDKMPMHVTRLKDAALAEWLTSEGSKPKAVVFSDKGTVSPLVKALAVDFLGSIDFAFMKSSEKAAVEQFGVKAFPAVVLVRSEDKGPIIFDGELNKASLVTFLSQAAAPNPAPPLVEAKKPKASKSKDSKRPSSKSASKKPRQASETLDPASDPTDSPSPKVETPVPVQLPIKTPPQIARLETADALQKSCLHAKATTCILAILPDTGSTSHDDDAAASSPARLAVSSLSEIAHKHTQRGAKIFPFYSVPSSNPGGRTLLETLQIPRADAQSVRIVAVNAKRAWWAAYDGGEDDSGAVAVTVERWIDAIRYGEAKKQPLPQGIVAELQEETRAETPEAKAKAQASPIVIQNDGPIQVELLEELDDGHDEL